jgi:hypothetical protein
VRSGSLSALYCSWNLLYLSDTLMLPGKERYAGIFENCKN